MASRHSPATHEVFNQPPVLENYNLYAANLALQEAVEREGAGWAQAELDARGAELGSAEWQQRGELANRYPPTPRFFDRYGHRTDAFDFHPAWHECLAYLKGHGVATGAWAAPRPGAHVRRAALFQMFAEVECGSLCPTTMTYGAVPIISREPGLAETWLPLLLSPEYDRCFLPASQKRGILMGMGMTEKQGGSDVRANTTRAEPEPGLGAGWHRLTGHKWFFSAPMCDAFLVTARDAEGLSCFFLPRFTPDGRLNNVRIQRAKDKLGDRSNASAEVEFDGALACRVDEAGHGIRVVMEMATYTRLDCANGSVGLMRAALSQALHHAAHRQAFGKRLWDQPLMRNVLADLALEVEAHTSLALRLAGAFDRQADEAEAALGRLLTPAAKYWICKRGPVVGVEAMEAVGGNGYIEEGPMPRIYRQLPLNSLWEGAGNLMGLDVLRAVEKVPRSVEALMAELAPARGRNTAFDCFVARVEGQLGEAKGRESDARRLAESIALAVQGALLLRFAPDFAAESFCATRLAGDWGNAFGTLPSQAPFGEILRRAWPPSS